MASKRNPKSRKNAGRNARRARRVEARNNSFVSAVTFHGDGSRTLELTQDGTDTMRGYMDWLAGEYVRRWGREPGPNDPVFPDFDAPAPIPMSAAVMEVEMVAAMEAAGLDPAFIYAYQQSGVLLTESNQDLVDPEAAAEWDAAIERWQALHP